MEASIATTKASCHARTNSLPSRSHPLIVNVEDQLQRLRASVSLEATTSSTSILCQNLAGLKDLSDCVDNMLQLPLAQKALCNEQQDHKCVEDVLDGSLRLLDMCGNTRDVFSYVKSCTQELESSLRRRNVREFSLANEIDKYMISRKKVKRMVRKCSSNLKQDNLQIISDQELLVVAIVDILREVESVSFTVFNSLLSFVSLFKARSKSNTGWFLVSKFIQSKRVSCEEQENEEDIILDRLEKLDCALYDLVRNKKGIDAMQLQKALKGLQALESTMQEIEEGLESVFRCLIKTRVSLLNILNH
ncbi:hypothetical protein EZV62_021116 [Acer yangbiense]|uniref:DUF241 domain-containing protein n=1 Tax=Acer yangbiense TaxID=1000413 RepID=A0A5C7H4Q8_9ROSI|nr:hypothetical protein EZV62_021116 [Acer yangbiense]